MLNYQRVSIHIYIYPAVQTMANREITNSIQSQTWAIFQFAVFNSLGTSPRNSIVVPIKSTWNSHEILSNPVNQDMMFIDLPWTFIDFPGNSLRFHQNSLRFHPKNMDLPSKLPIKKPPNALGELQLGAPAGRSSRACPPTAGRKATRRPGGSCSVSWLYMVDINLWIIY